MPLVTDAQRRAVLLWTGVKLAKDGKSIFNYNPGIFHNGLNFLLALPLLPSFVSRGHFAQAMLLLALMQFQIFVGSDATSKGLGMFDQQIEWCYKNLSGLSRFVLGLFVSLVLSKTYYANRGVFGTVFGCSMGLAEMVVAWVRPPLALRGDRDAQECAKKAQDLLVRWINAGFRLMWLEVVPGLSTEEIAKDILKEGLLTEKEWKKVEKLSSRCTHIYQWIANVLLDLYEKQYIISSQQLVKMTTQVDNMRGANVWGLPSLPIAYTQLITHMVKVHLLLLAFNNGGCGAMHYAIGREQGFTERRIMLIVFTHLDVIFHNYLFQGLLDLHGALYSPNAGVFLGHLPALNFMVFVRNVTEHLVSENDTLPYSLELVGPDRAGSDGDELVAVPSKVVPGMANQDKVFSAEDKLLSAEDRALLAKGHAIQTNHML